MKKLLLIIGIGFLASCANLATIEKSWKDENTVVDASNLQKVLVVAFLKGDVNRRTTEDKLVNLLKGKGIASYNYLPANTTEADKEKVKSMMAKDNFDGAVIMRLLDVDKDVTYTPGTFNTFPMYYRNVWGYYYPGWQNFQNPGYYSNTKTYSIEVNIYSVKQDKLVYSSLTKYTNPDNVAKAMEGAANAVFKEMKKQGFVVNAQ